MLLALQAQALPQQDQAQRITVYIIQPQHHLAQILLYILGILLNLHLALLIIFRL